MQLEYRMKGFLLILASLGIYLVMGVIVIGVANIAVGMK